MISRSELARKIDYILNAAKWVVTIRLLIRFVPKNKIRTAHVASKQKKPFSRLNTGT